MAECRNYCGCIGIKIVILNLIANDERLDRTPLGQLHFCISMQVLRYITNAFVPITRRVRSRIIL
jgi:hypothetical protein